MDKDVLQKIESLIEQQAYDAALDLIDQSLEGARLPKVRYQLANAKVVVLLCQNRCEEALAVHKSGIFWGIELMPEGLRSQEYLDRSYNAIVIYEGLGNSLAAELAKYWYHLLSHEPESKIYVDEIDRIVQSVEERICIGERSPELFKQLTELYIIQSEVSIFYAMLLVIRSGISAEQMAAYTDMFPVIGEHIRKYIPIEEQVCGFMERQPEDTRSKAMALVASCTGKPIYYVKYPLSCEVESLNLDKEDVLRVITDNKITEGNITYFTPLLLTDKSGAKQDTTWMVMEHLTDMMAERDSLFMLADLNRLAAVERSAPAGLTCNLIYQEEYLWHKVDLTDRPRMCILETHNKNRMKQYAKVYGLDIMKSLEEPSQVKISIVIPLRNCPQTLRYTLLSCLDQTYEDYEIVLSDNGNPEDQSIRALAEEFNAKCTAEGRSPKIRYYKTPGLLPLPKSFEYAYLQAKGEFLFGIGADDALIPDSLGVLARCLDEHPDADVIQWQRGNYFWPDMPFGNRDLLIYNPDYTQGVYETDQFNAEALLRIILDGAVPMYALPMCYINSGMRRRYIKKIIEQTGSFIGGATQDIYMGLLNLHLNQNILLLKYPMTIAGQGNGSVGAEATVGRKDSKTLIKEVQTNKESLVLPEAGTLSQKKMPMTSWDQTLLVNQLLRIQNLNLKNVYDENNINYRGIFEQALEQLSPTDQRFDYFVYILCDAARWHGEEFYQWFEPLVKSAYDNSEENRLRFIEMEKRDKCYQERLTPDETGMIWADASRLGIYDVYAAAKYVASQMKR